ncbi:MAG: hypothetical protein K0S32_1239 [Bacteroidetes bacterium]|jgi:hypothetical protein|nr:hypothetical protein [Bacteroidota bacterium]
MMKNIYFILCFFIAGFTFSQSPSLINYQGIARDAAGVPITTPVKIRFEIYSSLSGGTAVYSEVQTTSTNSLGIFSTQIGKTTGTINVNWGSGNNWFLDVAIDPTNVGTNFISTGRQQLVSVPYALYARESSNGLPPGDKNGQTLRWDTTLATGPAWVKDNNLTNDGSHVGIGLLPAGLKSRLHVITNAIADTSVIFAYHPNIASKGAAVRGIASGNVASSTSTADPFAGAIFGGSHSSSNTGNGMAIGNFGSGASNGLGIGVAGIAYGGAATSTAVGLYATSLGVPGSKTIAAIFDKGSVYFNDSIFITGTNSVNANPGDVLTLSPYGRAKWQAPGGSSSPFTTSANFVHLTAGNLNNRVVIGAGTPNLFGYGNKFTVLNPTGNNDTAVSVIQNSNKLAMFVTANSSSASAIYAKTNASGSSTAPAIFGEATGSSTNNAGVYGLSNNFSTGVKGYSGSFNGVWGESNGGTGVLGQSSSGFAARFLLTANFSSNPGVYIATNSNPPALKAESFGTGPAIEAVQSNAAAGSSNISLLIKNGHISTTGTNTNAACFTTTSFGATGFVANKATGSNDVRGEILATFTPSAVIPSGGFVTITVNFEKPYSGGLPNVHIECMEQVTASLGRFISGGSSSGFTVRFFNNTPGGMGLSGLNFKYFVIE